MGGKLLHSLLELHSSVIEFIRIAWRWQAQQDVSEFYIKLLPAILEGNVPIAPTIRGLFEFDITASLTCPHCLDVTSQTNPQYNLDIHVNTGGLLTNILRRVTFSGSTIHGRHCANCNRTGNSSQPYRLVKGPDVLVINLLRFTGLVKNMARVEFAQDINLTEFTNPRTELKYRLAAAIHHRGTQYSGHYKAVAKCPGGTWQDLNDRTVTNVRASAALHPGQNWTPYVLFWTRVDAHGVARTRL